MARPRRDAAIKGAQTMSELVKQHPHIDLKKDGTIVDETAFDLVLLKLCC